MWILVVSPPRERPRAWSLLAAPFPVAACWWARTRVQSSIRYSLSGSSMSSGEHPLPHARLRPAREALVHALPLAVPLGQVAPVRAGPQHPQNAIHEQAVVAPGPARIAGLARQQLGDPRPLRVAQLVSLDHPQRSKSDDPEPNESAPIPIGNPECRLDLMGTFVSRQIPTRSRLSAHAGSQNCRPTCVKPSHERWPSDAQIIANAPRAARAGYSRPAREIQRDRCGSDTGWPRCGGRSYA